MFASEVHQHRGITQSLGENKIEAYFKTFQQCPPEMLCVNRVNLLRHHYFVLISNKQLLYQVSKSFFILTRGMRLSALSASLRPKTGFSEFVKSSKLSNTAYYWETYSHLKNLTTFNSKSYIPQPSPPPLINLIIIWILVTLRTQSVRPHSQECYSQCLDLTAFSPRPIPHQT